MFGYDRAIRLQSFFIPDGLSNTLMLIETGMELGHWARGGPSTVRDIEPGAAPYVGVGRSFGGFHSTRENWSIHRRQLCPVSMADASTRYLTDSIAPEVLEALSTVSGREPVPNDW